MGRPAHGPVALCEVQGYVYAAKRGMAADWPVLWPTLFSMRIQRSDHQRLTFLNGWPFCTVKLDSVAMDLAANSGKFWLDQHAFNIRGGFQFIRLKDYGAPSGRIFANFNNGGIKAGHMNYFGRSTERSNVLFPKFVRAGEGGRMIAK